MKNVCCDKVELQKSSRGDTVENEFIFDAFVYFEPVRRFKNRSSGVFLSETVEDYSTVSCSSQV